MDSNQLDELNTYWMQQVTAWKSSGMPQSTFCKKHDLIYHRFIYWKLKFLPVAAKKSEFVKVRPDHSGIQRDSGLALSLPNGMILKGLSDSNLSLACQLIKQLS